MIGIQSLVDPQGAIIDLLFVHGLDSDPIKSWTDNKSGVCWIKDLLSDALPDARVMTFGYDAATFGAPKTSSSTLFQHSEVLVENIARLRRDTKTMKRPLMFLAHSLGGIVVKEALVLSYLSNQIEKAGYRDVFNSTQAVLYFGTPHLGSNWSTLHGTIIRISKAFVSATDAIVRHLETGSDHLQRLQVQYANINSGFKTISFYEEYRTRLPGGKLAMLVDRDSAAPPGQTNSNPVRLNKDHVDIVKYNSKDDEAFITVMSYLKGMIEDMKLLIARAEADALEAKEKAAAAELRNTNEYRTQVLRWLEAPDAVLLHRGARKLHQPGTGSWFLNLHVFDQWKHESHSIIWLYGKSGCGKTILFYVIVEHLLELATQNDRSAVLYHYCNFQDPTQRTCADIVASLVDQLLRQGNVLPETILRMYKEESRRPRNTAPLDILATALKNLVATFDDVYLLVDALDECADVEELLSLLDMLSQWQMPQLHVIVTSQRHKTIIVDCLEQLVPSENRMDMVLAAGEEDIRSHIYHFLSNDVRLLRRWSTAFTNLMDEIVQTLVQKADNSFRWVACQLHSLCRCTTPAEVKEALLTLPEDLDETYDRIFQQLDITARSRAEVVLEWLAFARRPMNLGELSTILSEREPKESDCTIFHTDDCVSIVDVAELCQGLTVSQSAEQSYLEVCGHYQTWLGEPEGNRRQYDSLTFSHSSVRDWVLKRAARPGKTNRVTFGHERLAKTTLSFVLQYSPQSTYPNSPDYPILWSYAATEWPYHSKLGSSAEVQQLAQSLLTTQSPQFQQWRATLLESLSDSVVPLPSPLYFASLFSLDWAIEPLIHAGENVNAVGGMFGYPLQAASAANVVDVSTGYAHASLPTSVLDTVKTLLAHGALVDVRGGIYGSAFQTAMVLGKHDVAQVLLDHGADVDSASGEYGTALHWAAASGRFDAARFLLAKGASINIYGGEYGSALQAAASRGHINVVRLLLDESADIQAGINDHGDVFQSAVYWGHLEVARLLLDRGADINAFAGAHGSALYAAAYEDRYDIAQFLLRNGADPNAVSGEDGYPLHAAVNWGHFRLAQLLLDNGANVNDWWIQGNTLQLAISQGSVEMVKLLLDKGADVTATNDEYGGALHAAVYWDNIEMVYLLLDGGADVNTFGGRHGSPLSVAVCRGNLHLAQILLDRGAEVNGASGKFGSVLQVAAQFGVEMAAIQFLVSRGADVNAAYGEFPTALQSAVVRGRLDIAIFLLDNHVDVNACNPEGDPLSPLQLAVSAAVIEPSLIRFLLITGADVNYVGGAEESALYIACSRGNVDVVDILLEGAADINLPTQRNGSALQVAAAGCHVELVRLLINNGANVNAIGGEYGSALHAASAHNCLQIVENLLDSGADANNIVETHGTALQVAVSEGHTPIAQLLLHRGAEVNNDSNKGIPTLQAAVIGGSLDVVNLLLDQGAEVNTYYNNATALHCAARFDHLEIAQLLLDRGAEVNAASAGQVSSLQVAASEGNLKIVELLLNQGADINFSHTEVPSALQLAIYKGHYEVVQCLLEKEADFNDVSSTQPALAVAAGQGETDIVRLLIFNGADVDSLSREFGSALQIATLSGNLGMVLLLLEHGANVEQSGGSRGSALTLAIEEGFEAIAAALLDAGAGLQPDLLLSDNGVEPHLTLDNATKLSRHGDDSGSDAAGDTDTEDCDPTTDDHLAGRIVVNQSNVLRNVKKISKQMCRR